MEELLREDRIAQLMPTKLHAGVERPHHPRHQMGQSKGQLRELRVTDLLGAVIGEEQPNRLVRVLGGTSVGDRLHRVAELFERVNLIPQTPQRLAEGGVCHDLAPFLPFLIASDHLIKLAEELLDMSEQLGGLCNGESRPLRPIHEQPTPTELGLGAEQDVNQQRLICPQQAVNLLPPLSWSPRQQIMRFNQCFDHRQQPPARQLVFHDDARMRLHPGFPFAQVVLERLVSSAPNQQIVVLPVDVKHLPGASDRLVDVDHPLVGKLLDGPDEPMTIVPPCRQRAAEGLEARPFMPRAACACDPSLLLGAEGVPQPPHCWVIRPEGEFQLLDEVPPSRLVLQAKLLKGRPDVAVLQENSQPHAPRFIGSCDQQVRRIDLSDGGRAMRRSIAAHVLVDPRPEGLLRPRVAKLLRGERLGDGLHERLALFFCQLSEGQADLAQHILFESVVGRAFLGAPVDLEQRLQFLPA